MTADEMRALTAAATPGPWHPDEDYIRGPGGEYVANVNRATNTELVVWLRNHADALADLIDFVKTVERPGCNNQPSCAERPPRSGLMCLPCSATQALAALDADR